MNNPTAPRFLPPRYVFAFAIVSLFTCHASANAAIIQIGDLPTTLPSAITLGGVEYDALLNWGVVNGNSPGSGLTQPENEEAMAQLLALEYDPSGPSYTYYTLYLGLSAQDVTKAGMETSDRLDWWFDGNGDITTSAHHFTSVKSISASSLGGSHFGSVQFVPAAVPEPASVVVWSFLGAMGLAIAGWRRRFRSPSTSSV